MVLTLVFTRLSGLVLLEFVQNGSGSPADGVVEERYGAAHCLKGLEHGHGVIMGVIL